jgi:outer membrane protein TolC
MRVVVGQRTSATVRRAATTLGLLAALAAGCHTPWDLPSPPDGGDRPGAPVAVHVHAQQARPVAPEAAGSEPLAPAAHIEQSVPPPCEETIDLGVALRLAGADNPTVNLAREQVREALAGQLAARSLLLPTVNVGGNYRFHNGPLQDDPGEFRNVTLQSGYFGLGAVAVGANPVAVPGVRLFAHLGDAVYEPLAARQRVAVRRSDAQAVQNRILLEVAVAYLELIGAEARLDVLRRAEADVDEIARVTAEFARTGQGAPPDANRAGANAELIRRQLRQAEGGVAVASARLARLLSLDPSLRLRSPGGPVESFRLAPENANLEGLLAVGVQARPETVARAAAIREAQVRIRQEKVRPFVPTLSVGYSAGTFGGGGTLAAANSSPWSGRSDFDVIAVWNVQNLGVGNHARVRAANAAFGQAVAGYDAALNQIRREIAEAQADARSAAQQIEAARVALAGAEEGFKLEKQRVNRAEGRPIEALDSFRQLTDARLDLVAALIAYDVAQFRLFVALGNNPAAGPSSCASDVPQP